MVFEMKIIKQQIWLIAGAAVLLTAAFALGYVVGNRSQKPLEETANTLTSTDMQHAFGSAKTPEPFAEHAPQKQESASMSLSGLVAGLEKKVAANPGNIDQQLLLAQTYNELDNRAKSLDLLRSVNKQAPKHVQVKITLATVLMTGTDKQELKDALVLFDDAIKLKPDVASMARIYQGEIRVKLDNLSK